ncbi:hypothetical protein [Dietzia alimentaria]|uniref:hypothetical protein n=1 Tax=Dietzia alimentaria TaxID=665550 RepID=UPI00029A655F|nr:hypothetical protein [Dietzia alimentaria]
MPLRPRSRAFSARKRSSGEMDLGTRALVLGVGSLALSWIPVINIVAFVGALMAVAFGLLARWPTGWLTNGDPDTTRALWGVVLGAIAMVVFVVTAVRYSAI